MRSLYADVGEFLAKFGHEAVISDGASDRGMSNLRTASPRRAADALERFRLGLLQEEVVELAVGYEENDLAKIADALVDVVYVALGTAHAHGLPFDEIWDAVQRANMAKERCGIDHKFVPCGHGFGLCTRQNSSECHWVGMENGAPVGCDQPEAKHSKRGSAEDIIKPEGWTPPDVGAILRKYQERVSGPREDDPRFWSLGEGVVPTHYVLTSHGPRALQNVFVKEAPFFEQQGGLTQDWGRNWEPVRALDPYNLEEARMIGWCRYRQQEREAGRG